MALVTVNNDETDDFRSRPRWSVNRKVDVVLRLLRGEKLEELSRELGVEAHRIAALRDDFLAGGKEQLKGKRPTTALGTCAPRSSGLKRTAAFSALAFDAVAFAS